MSTAYIYLSNIAEKRNRDRKLDSAERRREWTERFGATSRSSDRVIGPRGMPSNVDFGLSLNLALKAIYIIVLM